MTGGRGVGFEQRPTPALALFPEVLPMPRFSANLSFLYPELPFLDRLDAAGASGFRGVEYMSPYEYELAQIKRRLHAHGMAQVLFNLPVGDFAKGERGYATDPARVK